jgi:NAD(P)H dehydrogenase (quinone)
MRILVIRCHPDKASFSNALHAAVIESLSASGHAITGLDLYGEGFDPIFSLEDRVKYSDPPLYVKSVGKYAAQLAAAEAIVVVYPSWWFGMPAMLKGYFDRVWAPGIAYDVGPNGQVETNRLAHIQRIAVVTTYGSTWWLVRVYLGDPTRKLWSRGVRRLCGRHCRLDLHVHYDMDHSTPARLTKFLHRVKDKMARW